MVLSITFRVEILFKESSASIIACLEIGDTWHVIQQYRKKKGVSDDTKKHYLCGEIEERCLTFI